MSVLTPLEGLRLGMLGQRVEKASAILPATTTQDLFTVAGGRVLVTSLVGEVTVVFDGTVNSLNVLADPTVGAAANLCAATVCTSDAAGTLYTVSGIQADLLGSQKAGGTEVPSHAVARIMPGAAGFVVHEGKIQLNATATDTTGSTAWTITYIPYDAGATVVSA